MADDGLLIVNYRYSSILGKEGEFAKGIEDWTVNPKKAGQKQAGKYRIQIEYNLPTDVIETGLFGGIYGIWGQGGKSQKGKKDID